MIWKLITIAFFCALIIAGCGAPELRPDPSISSISAFYPSAEFQACGATHHGLAICVVEKGDDINQKVNLKIQGYNVGSYRVDSRSCDIAKTARYGRNQLISVPLPTTAQDSCVVSFTVSPEFKKANQEVFGLQGQLIIKVVEKGEELKGFTFKRSGDFRANARVFVGGTGKVRLVLIGCGGGIDKESNLDKNGFLTVPFHESVNLVQGLCLIDGIVISPGFKNLKVSAVMAIYTEGFIPLSIPQLEVSKGKLSVTADDTVSIIGFNSNYEFDSKAKFNFDEKKDHVLRLLTVKGRSVIGIYSGQKKEWAWLQ